MHGSPGPERPTTRQAHETVMALAAALAHVHACGWTHADVTPSNVVMSAAGPTLIDFGSARRAEPRRGLAPGAPTRGTATPGYIAPERLLGRPWDSRADVYALGCIWFELLSGRPLFRAPDVDELCRQHLKRAVPSVHTTLPDLEPSLARLLDGMLAKDRHARPSDLAVVAEAIAGALGTRAVLTRKSAPLFQSRLFGRSAIWNALESQLTEAMDGHGGATLVVGAPGLGRTRLLHEAAQRAHESGLEVLEATDIEVGIAAPPEDLAFKWAQREMHRGACLLVADDATLETLNQLLAARALAPEDKAVLVLAAVDVELASKVADSGSRDWRMLTLTALSRDASRRMVADVFAQPVGESLQATLWRECVGHPRSIQETVEHLRAEGRLARNEQDEWELAEAHRSPPAGRDGDGDDSLSTQERDSLSEQARRSSRGNPRDHARAAELFARAGDVERAVVQYRLAAAQARRASPPDPNRAIRHLEAAFAELRAVAASVPRTQRTALRLGYTLLGLLSKTADHNSVHALARDLVALCGEREALLEAKIRRLDALSYRVTGDNADALHQLERALAGLGRLPPGLRVKREYVLNRLGASWAHYSSHDGAASLAAATEILPHVRATRSAEHRAEAILHAAKAIALMRRYEPSRRVIRLERRAVAVLESGAAPPRAVVSAQSNLAFMLLHGNIEECSEGVAIFERFLAKAQQAADMTALTRVATYLAFGQRRLGHIDACEAHSRLTLELSMECGQPGYVGVARACLGWVALRRGKLEQARAECESAVQLWQRRRALDPTRYGEYPFQWLAILPLVALAVADEQAASCAPRVSDLIHPTQARLARPLDTELERAANAKWSDEEWDAWGARLVRLATKHRYL
jgi:hypothetical protein